MDEDDVRYRVVVNDEEQYSIWPAVESVPDGWHEVGVEGSRTECLDHIELVWTDMRPRSLRERMAAVPDGTPSAVDELLAGILDDSRPDLVTRLATGEHPVELMLRPEPTVSRLREALDHQYVHIRFPDTEGGTELGVRISGPECDLAAVDRHIEPHTAQRDGEPGHIRLVGELSLDGAEVRCVAKIDLATFTGSGHLVHPGPRRANV